MCRDRTKKVISYPFWILWTFRFDTLKVSGKYSHSELWCWMIEINFRACPSNLCLVCLFWTKNFLGSFVSPPPYIIEMRKFSPHSSDISLYLKKDKVIHITFWLLITLNRANFYLHIVQRLRSASRKAEIDDDVIHIFTFHNYFRILHRKYKFARN